MGELVSCLCVSRPQRWGQLQRSILDFLGQTYKDRELVIAVDNGNDYASMIQSFVDQQMIPDDGPKVSVIQRLAKSQLEGLMYAAVHASGRILCLWDDDNLNHPTRLETQISVQQKFKSAITVLTEGLYYFHKDHELFVVSCDRPDGVAGRRVLASSLMAYREFFPVMDPSVRGKPCEQMVSNTARAGKKIVPINGLPYLHLVGVTYDHIRGYDYHRSVAQEQGRQVAWLNANKDAILAAVAAYKWDGKLTVEGTDAGAFEFTPETATWPGSLYPVKVDPDPDPAKAANKPATSTKEPA